MVVEAITVLILLLLELRSFIMIAIYHEFVSLQDESIHLPDDY